MSENTGLRRVFEMRYGFPRIQWLIGIVSIISLIYTTTDLWKIVDSQPFPEIDPTGFVIYVGVFACLLIVANIYDVSRLNASTWKILLIALISTGIDLLLISSAEWLSLNAIGMFPQDYIKGTSLLLLGSLPASIGSIVLSSLTAKALKERSKKLYEEVKSMHKELDSLQVLRKNALDEIKKTQEENKELIKQIEEEPPRRKE